MLRRRVANINFKIRVKDETINSDNPYRWDVLTSNDILKEKKILLFSLQLLLQLVQRINYLTLKNFILFKEIKHKRHLLHIS